MGLRKTGLQVIENDALVVLAFPFAGKMTWVQFQRQLRNMGFECSNSKVHSMLSRAKGRVTYNESTDEWSLTAHGREYQRHVEETLERLVRTG